MSEIAQAFVRIRPDTRGFQAEAQTGIRAAFTGLAKVAAGAFVIREAANFGEGIIKHAADIQKQIEVVKNEFGAASDAVLSFNEKGAAAFGISAHLADQTSARFGILFKNLGIGQEQAAKMTIGFEQLAGSLSSIRGVDPSLVLRNIPLAVAGNLRSLKQMGIATDQTQLKLAAFKLGLTSTISQALTPAQRAIAIYSIATSHLSDFQAQAAAHSGDLATRMRILSAEWDNAKDRLGAGLLPAVTSMVNVFANQLPGAIRGAGVVFRDLRQDIQGIASAITPAVRPVVSTITRMVTDVASAFEKGGIRGAVGALVADFQRLSPVARAVGIAVAAAAALMAASFVAAFASFAPITTAVLAILGIGVAFREAMKHSATFRADLARIGDVIHGTILPALSRVEQALTPVFKAMEADAAKAAVAIRDGLGKAFDFLSKHQQAVEIIAGAVAGAAAAFVTLRIATAAYAAVARIATAVQIAFDAAMDANPVTLIVLAIGALIGALVVLYTRSATVRRVVNTIFDGVESATRKAIAVFKSVGETLLHIFGPTVLAVVRNTFSGILGFIRGVLRTIRGVIEVFSGVIHGDWSKVWAGLKDIVGGVFDSIKALVKTEAGNIEAIFSGMWKAIELVFLEGVRALIGILAKIPSVHVHVPGLGTVGFTNPFKGMDDALGRAIDHLKGTAGRAATEVPQAVAEAGAKARAGMAREVAASSNQAIADAGKAAADVVSRGADTAEAAKAAQDAADRTAAAVKSISDKLQTAVAQQDAGIAKARAKVKTLGQQIADALTQEAQDVHDAVQQAESNLNSIGSSLASSISQLLDKPIQDAQNRISAASNRQALEQLRQSVLLPGGKQLSTDPTKALAQLRALASSAGSINRAAIQSFISQYQSAVLAVKQDQVNVTKETATRRISDLTDAFNRGQISLTDYKKRILALLTADRVSYKRAGSLLGTAFANGFRDQVQGLFAQAAAIASTPASARRGITGTDITIVKPLDTIQKDQRSIAALTHQKMDAQTALQKRIAAAAEKTAKLQAQIAAVKVNPDIGQKTGTGTGRPKKPTTG